VEVKMAWWNRLNNFLEKVLMAVACIILAGATLSLSAQAFGRTLFSRSWGLLEELPALFMPYIVFLLLGVALRRGLHVSVDLLPTFLRGRAKDLLMVAIYVAIAMGSCLFLYGALLGVRGFYQMGFKTTTEIAFPIWIFYLSLVIGFAILILFSSEMFLKSILSLKKDSQTKGNREEKG
jgi:TRAP-type C4-dicarboxylate transport system permease small subunit